MCGAPGKIRTCDLSLRTTAAFTADDVPFVVWTLSSPTAFTGRRCPSSLYTFPPSRAWLGIATTGCAEVSPNLSRFTKGVSHPKCPCLATGGDRSILTELRGRAQFIISILQVLLLIRVNIFSFFVLLGCSHSKLRLLCLSKIPCNSVGTRY